MKHPHYLFLLGLLACHLIACESNPSDNTTTTPPQKTEPLTELPVNTPSTTGEDWKETATAFVQTEQTLLKEVEGDLNNDGISDKVLVLDNPADTQSKNDLSPPRTLVILQGNPQGQYRLWASSDQVVLCAECGGVLGDPFRTITIEEETIQIQQDGGSRERWERNSSIVLQPSSEEWMVVKDEMKVVDTYDASNNSNQNMLAKGQLPLEQYNAYGE